MTISRPPNGPRIRPITEPTWQRIAADYAMVAAIPLLLWVVSHPVAGAATLTISAALVVAGRRAYALTRCLRECRQVTFQPGGRTRITVARGGSDEVCCPAR